MMLDGMHFIARASFFFSDGGAHEFDEDTKR
jgi:hypothetical protein